MARANTGHAPGYGDDEWTSRAANLLRELFEVDCEVFFTFNGTAANALALRLARAYTGAADIVVVDHADHGALPDLAAISPYRFDAPGGTGRPGHVWVAEMPDPYRGRLREGDKDIGVQYADSVATLVMDMVGLGRKPMAFIATAVQESGGVIPFPAGYLAAAYRHVRHEGGLCIADEVGLGIGRAG